MFPWKFQHTPGSYPKQPSTTCFWRKSSHFCILGYLGYIPGVCWEFFKIDVNVLPREAKEENNRIIILVGDLKINKPWSTVFSGVLAGPKLYVTYSTPPKVNMSPKNGPLQQVKACLPTTRFLSFRWSHGIFACPKDHWTLQWCRLNLYSRGRVPIFRWSTEIEFKSWWLVIDLDPISTGIWWKFVSFSFG